MSTFSCFRVLYVRSGLVWAMILLLGCNVAYAQSGQSMLSSANFPVAGDTLVKNELAYVDAGSVGSNVLWDFHSLEWKEDIQTNCICPADSSGLLCVGSMSVDKYSLQADTLFLVGTESPLSTMNYRHPIPLLLDSFAYGDTLAWAFQGEGTYCQMHRVLTAGTVRMVADGDGSLILAEGDTLRNVLRIHTLKTSSIGMQLLSDTTELDPESLRQEITDQYQWYVKGIRYPVLETISTACYNDLTLISCAQNAYCSLDQPLDYEGQEEVEEGNRPDEPAVTPIIAYEVTVNGGVVTVSYSLTEAVPLTALVCDRLGYVYHSITASNAAGTDYSLALDCTGLRSDVYILYLNVGGQVYSEKIDLRY